MNNISAITNDSNTQNILNLIKKLGVSNYLAYLSNLGIKQTAITICTIINS